MTLVEVRSLLMNCVRENEDWKISKKMTLFSIFLFTKIFVLNSKIHISIIRSTLLNRLNILDISAIRFAGSDGFLEN